MLVSLTSHAVATAAYDTAVVAAAAAAGAAKMPPLMPLTVPLPLPRWAEVHRGALGFIWAELSRRAMETRRLSVSAFLPPRSGRLRRPLRHRREINNAAPPSAPPAPI